jgi:molybdopterin/thiamine biosynthesis adenylyltransferase
VTMAQSAEKDLRYSRQILLPEVGSDGQEKLKNAAILLVGAGGLGSPCAYYLAAAGVGVIGIADDDAVEMSNLNRQILHSQSRIGKPKVISAKETIESFNPHVTVKTYPYRLSSGFPFEDEIEGYDLVIDCSDNYDTRYRINELCIKKQKPWIFGAVSEFEGQVMTIIPGKSPCYRCLYPSAAMSGQIPAVIGVTPGVIGILQAAEALKHILDTGNLLTGRFLHVDLKDMQFDVFRLTRNVNCPSCAGLFKAIST